MEKENSGYPRAAGVPLFFGLGLTMVFFPVKRADGRF
jgi:hypothetical protein